MHHNSATLSTGLKCQLDCIWIHMHQVLAIINIQLHIQASYYVKWRCQLDRIWLHMHQVLAIINIQLLIQASYYDNQNNRGRDEKKQFQGNEGIDSKRWLMPKFWQLSIFNYNRCSDFMWAECWLFFQALVILLALQVFKHRITIIKIIAGEMKRNNFEEMKESIRNDG